MKKILASVTSSFFLLTFFLSFASVAYAVPVRTYGGVNASSGNYYLQSDSSGNGNLTPGSQVTVDSYLFQCQSSGSAACSTEWNSDATLVQKWQNTMTVPDLNQRTAQITHSFSLPYGNCGRVQYDQGIVGIPGAIGGWVYDFGQSCTTASPSPAPSCSGQQPTAIQFRSATTGQWQGGSNFGSSLQPGQAIDVNCFAQNGTALLNGGYIDVTTPNGQRQRLSNTAEARNYILYSAGSYSFTCGSTTMSSCTNTDTVSVYTAATPYPTPTPTPNPSTCTNLQVISGNNTGVPAHVTLQASGTDPRGSIQLYRYYFGDGQQLDTNQSQVSHDYNVSGTFTPQVYVLDMQGNWQTSSACQTTVSVQSSFIESPKSGCSNVAITADNNGRAPSRVTFDVTGYDNKGSLQAYRVDYGNGNVVDQTNGHFENIYTTAGTYDIHAYVRDSSGNWVGGDQSCHQTLAISSSQALTVQPATGTPTVLPLLGLGSGGVGLALQILKRKLHA